MPGRDVVVIGASAGGVTALRELVAGLPAGLPAAVLIVVHTGQRPTSRLATILSYDGPLPAAPAVPGQRLTPGLLTIAPPGHHLIVTGGDILRLHRGPPVQHARPAADLLMRSAAAACGPRVIAVVLSGMLRDGADGAAAVAAAGGAVLVQDPGDAARDGMPRAALDRVPDAPTWPASKLGPAIADLVGVSAPARALTGDGDVGGIAEALWLAVSSLQTRAAVQRRLGERFPATSALAVRARTEADRALHAAELITTHALPGRRDGEP